MGADSPATLTSQALPDDLGWAFANLQLPPRLQSQICKRIRGVAILTLVTCAVSFVFAINAWRHGEPREHSTLQFVGIGLAVLAASLIIRLVDRLRLRTAVLLALFIEFMICLFISVGNPSYELPIDKTLPGVTWIVPIIIMFPLLIPTPPKWTLGWSIACVMTVPLGTLIAYEISGRPEVNLAKTLPFAMISPAVGAIIAYFGSSLVNEMGVYAEKIRHAGNFTRGDKIGAGGMGVVYAAEHNRLPMCAAIKYIKPDQLKKRFGGREAAIRRFEREAETLAKLCSPHSIEIYDFDVDDEGSLFYVMELLEGWDLNTLVDYVGVVPPARVAHLLAQACGALAEAHELGVVHRDVKPSNIMTCHYGRNLDFVKVLDFGIMTLRKEELEQDHPSWGMYEEGFQQGLTQGNLVVGTPDYMSPEQVKNESLDARSDIYALGCVGYYLLTGKLLFEGGDDRDKMRRHVEETPLRPSQKSDQDIPQAMDDLIMACLQKRPEDRPKNADELALAFRASVPEGWGADQIGDWWREHGLPKRPSSSTTSIAQPSESPLKKPLWIIALWRQLTTWAR
jgi:eukaryotic-like serine/threonine-protein kinase